MNVEYRVINIPDQPSETKVPTMPILVILRNGVVIEARTVRGTVAAIVGSQYIDCEDAIDEWNERIIYARKETMLIQHKKVVVYDERSGIIPDNYTANSNEEDYEIDGEGEVSKIRVETEKGFLFSLARIGVVRILEKEGEEILTRKGDGEVIEIEEHQGGTYIDIVSMNLDNLINETLRPFR